MWEENQKIIDIIDEKIFQLGLKTRKEKPKVFSEKRNLVGINYYSYSQQS